jgi:hypothetical protein
MERLNLDKVKIMAAAATLAMFAGTACAHLEVYGQVNKEFIQTWSNTQDTGVFADNNYSPSKLGVMSSAHLNKCVTFGGVGELEFVPNNSRLVNQLNTETLQNHIVLVRKVDAWASAGMWGKLHLGLGEASSWGVTDLSFAGTHETSLGSSVANNAGGMYLAVKGSNAVAGDPTIRRVFQALNGVGDVDDDTNLLSTKDRVRYDTAEWMGLGASVSFGNVTHNLAANGYNYGGVANSRRTYLDVAVRYHGCWDDFKFAAAAAGGWYTKDAGNRVVSDAEATLIAPTVGTKGHGDRFWSGSIAAEHMPTGFNAAVAGGQKFKYVNLDNYGFWYVQLGKKFCLTHYGKTNVAIDYFGGRNAIVNHDKSYSYGLGITQDLTKINTALYASVRNYKYKDVPVYNFEAVTAATFGVLFKFGAML